MPTHNMHSILPHHIVLLGHAGSGKQFFADLIRDQFQYKILPLREPLFTYLQAFHGLSGEDFQALLNQKEATINGQSVKHLLESVRKQVETRFGTDYLTQKLSGKAHLHRRAVTTDIETTDDLNRIREETQATIILIDADSSGEQTVGDVDNRHLARHGQFDHLISNRIPTEDANSFLIHQFLMLCRNRHKSQAKNLSEIADGTGA